MALNYDAMNALTRKKYIPQLVDNIFASNPLLAYLKDRQKAYDGGTKIVQPLIYGEISNVGSYSGYDAITYDTAIPITAAEFSPKNLVAPIIISLEEERTNSGESAVLDLLESKIKIVEQTLNKQFSAQLWGNGTGNAAKDLDGFGAVFGAANTYGGIDRSTYAWWKPIIKTGSAGAKRPLTEALMVQTFLEASDGDDTPDVIFTDMAGWLQYYQLVKGRITIYTQDVKKALNLGFQTLEFMGKPVIMDKTMVAPAVDKCNFYFLNTKYLNLRYHPQANFTSTKWRPDDSRLAKKQEILWSGNLTCSNCRREALLTDIDVAGIALT